MQPNLIGNAKVNEKCLNMAQAVKGLPGVEPDVTRKSSALLWSRYLTCNCCPATQRGIDLHTLTWKDCVHLTRFKWGH
jgi:hypothetical protein